MSKNTELVKKLFQTCDAKDFTAVRELLHERYSFKGSCMKMESRDEMIAAMKQCPMNGESKNLRFIEEGNQVVAVFDWTVSSPFQATIPMCNVLTISGGKVLREELFFDTAKFPKEFQEMMKAEVCEKK
jgi:ketosteroid isomerase-like protein